MTEISDDEVRRPGRRHITRVATVAGAAATVVAVVLTMNAVTGSTPSHPILPTQGGTPSPSALVSPPSTPSAFTTPPFPGPLLPAPSVVGSSSSPARGHPS